MKLKMLGLGVLLVVLLAGAARASDRPNFLFILTDDQSPHTLGAYGNDVCQTPNIDAIAREGMLIRDAHHMGSWSGAVCLPSRTMIMTGRSVWRIPGGQPGGGRQQRAQLAAEVAQTSLPALFNAAGYDTFRTCKRGNTFAPANQLFQVRREGDHRGSDGSAWHGQQALDFLQQREKTGDRDPFLMFLGFSHPHDPRNGTADLLQKYGAVNTTQPPTALNAAAPPLQVNYLPAHPFPHGHPGLRDEVKVPGVLTDRSEATIRNELGREYACIENIDVQIGRVLKKLSAMGQLDNTYVVFTSDHGIAVGRHGLTGKQNLYEHTWKVPMLVRGPGIEPGSQASGYTYLSDVLPTFCDLAGIEVPAEIEGVSFRPVLEGKVERIRDVLYGVYCGGTKPGMRSVKTDGWKLIKYDVLDGAVRETQLFNLQDNPDELLAEHHSAEVIALTGNTPRPQQVNLARDPRHQQKLQELEELLLAEQRRLGDPYRLWNQPSERDQRMAWWREARFGMFVHWGLYSGLAGTWQGKRVGETGGMEWIQNRVGADTDTYADHAIPLFRPQPGFAKTWAQLAKRAGCRYLVFTTKHHDGFALHDSKVTDFDAASVLDRDLVREIVAACRVEGLRVGFYHSVIDWHHDQYCYAKSKMLPHPLIGQPYSNGQRRHEDYVDFLHAQVDELITNYGPVDIIWWDYSATDFQGDQAWRAFDLMAKVRDKHPQVIMNNRLFRIPEAGWTSMQMEGIARRLDPKYGDFITPEQHVPDSGIPGVDWETCMTMNTTWGYSRHDHQWKSAEALIRTLVDIVSKGGNYLLNIGPTGDGAVPAESVQRLAEIGKWMDVHGEAIYGCSASPIGKPSWGRVTQNSKTSTLYLHVFDWPHDGNLVVEGISGDVVGAALLESGAEISVSRAGGSIVLALPVTAPDRIATVIRLQTGYPLPAGGPPSTPAASHEDKAAAPKP